MVQRASCLTGSLKLTLRMVATQHYEFNVNDAMNKRLLNGWFCGGITFCLWEELEVDCK